MFTKAFLLATLERMIRGAAVAVATVLGLDGPDAIGRASALYIGVAALYGALASLVLALIGGAVGPGNGPSIFGTEVERKVP